MSAAPAGAPAGRVLCRLDDLAIPGSKGFTLGGGAAAREIFVVRNVAGVYAYENDCPHAGSLLDWVPDRFLTRDKTHILCATHGATFRIHDGYCVSGPCAGAGLTPVGITVSGGAVTLDDDAEG